MATIYCPVCGVTTDPAIGRALCTQDKITLIRHLRTHSVAGLKECKLAAEFMIAAAERKAEVTITQTEAELLDQLKDHYPALERLAQSAVLRMR